MVGVPAGKSRQRFPRLTRSGSRQRGGCGLTQPTAVQDHRRRPQIMLPSVERAGQVAARLLIREASTFREAVPGAGPLPPDYRRTRHRNQRRTRVPSRIRYSGPQMGRDVLRHGRSRGDLRLRHHQPGLVTRSGKHARRTSGNVPGPPPPILVFGDIPDRLLPQATDSFQVLQQPDRPRPDCHVSRHSTPTGQY